jgi:hypothetical protein
VAGTLLKFFPVEIVSQILAGVRAAFPVTPNGTITLEEADLAKLAKVRGLEYCSSILLARSH